MSQGAWMANCLSCPVLKQMQRGRLLFEERPCPSELPPRRKRSVHLSPQTVREQMPGNWKCSVRESLKGSAR